MEKNGGMEVESVCEGVAKWMRARVEEGGVEFESSDCTFH